MFQIDNDTAVAVLPAPGEAGPAGFFTGGDPDASLPPTDLPADYMNMLMMELINVVNAGGLAPSKVAYNQVVLAIASARAACRTRRARGCPGRQSS